MWCRSARTYDSKVWDAHRPSILIWCSERPLWVVVVAAPMRKEWEETCLFGMPDLFRMICTIFLEPLSGGRKVFVIDKQRVEMRGNLGFSLKKKKGYGLLSLDGGWQIENEDWLAAFQLVGFAGFDVEINHVMVYYLKVRECRMYGWVEVWVGGEFWDSEVTE